jgi:hypothetical protein
MTSTFVCQGLVALVVAFVYGCNFRVSWAIQVGIFKLRYDQLYQKVNFDSGNPYLLEVALADLPSFSVDGWVDDLGQKPYLRTLERIVL